MLEFARYSYIASSVALLTHKTSITTSPPPSRRRPSNHPANAAPHNTMASTRSLLVLRPQCLRLVRSPAASLSLRPYSDSKTPKGPNTETLPSAPEEAAATAKFTGQTPPDLSQGTPVSEVYTAPALPSIPPLTPTNRSSSATPRPPKMLPRS